MVLPDDVAVEGVLTDFRPREVIVDPMLYKGVPLGTIILASAAGFTNEVKSRLDLFGQGMALAMNNALTHDRLQKLAALDPMTGIYNRRFGMARLSEEFSRAVRTTGPLGVMMFDIDHFKKVNDTYGHLAGDRVLIQVTKTARAALREGDILMRYGGEEFIGHPSCRFKGECTGYRRAVTAHGGRNVGSRWRPSDPRHDQHRDHLLS